MRCGRYRRAAKPAAVVALPALVMSSRTAPAAYADEGDPVSLPVLRPRVGTDEACATASGTVAETQPWTHRALQLSRSWQLSKVRAAVDEGAGVVYVGQAVADDDKTPAAAGDARVPDWSRIAEGSFTQRAVVVMMRWMP
jgi:hypothetical protein